MIAELSHTDLGNVIRRLPKDIMTLLKEQRYILAGGFIRDVIAGMPVSDIDLFNADKEKMYADGRLFATHRGDARVHVTNNAMTVLAPPRLPVQFITRWLFSDPVKCMKSFDFTVCRAAIWYVPESAVESIQVIQNGGHGFSLKGKDGEVVWPGWHSVCDPRFYEDLAARRLTYTCPVREEEAGGSIMRACKFLKRGYAMSPETLAQLIDRLMTAYVPNSMPRVQVLSGLLREVDPLSVIDGLEILDEHAVIEGAL